MNASLQSSMAERRAGMTVLLLWGVPGHLLGLQFSYYSYILGTISWQGNGICENQHQDVYV